MTAVLPPRTSSTGRRSVTMLRGLAGRWLALAVLVAVWEAAARAAGDLHFPPPSEILGHMHRLWFSGPAAHGFLTSTATDNVFPSLGRLAVALTISALLGVVLGLALGRSEQVRAYLDPMLQFCRAIPPPTLVPVFIVFLNIGTQMQLVSIIFSSLWPVLLNTADGARSVDTLQLATAKVFRLSAVQRLRLIIIPSTMPQIFAGLRIALSLSLILMVFSELLPGTSNGIGFELTDAYSRSDLPTMWSVIVLLGVLGYLLNTFLLMTERRVLAWHRSARKAAQ
jgi:ABC-type nitrate/sulfonate/bicarbonate transport system permease component